MCVGLDIEETFKSVLMPGSWINNFHGTFLGLYDVPYMKQLQTAKKQPNGEKPGGPSTMRYSSADTLVLQYICEQIENKPFGTILQERVWSKVGFRLPAFLCLAPDGTGVGYGMFSTTAEDMLKFAMLFTPSWNKVSKEQIITDDMWKIFHETGKNEAYKDTEEQHMATQWHGVAPPKNGIQWDNVFDDGAMFKHGNNGQGIYVDPKRDFCAIGFGVAANTSGTDYAPGFMRTAAKLLAGE
jgi:CubicO group peptidase (beta-lactamase class C family)